MVLLLLTCMGKRGVVVDSQVEAVSIVMDDTQIESVSSVVSLWTKEELEPLNDDVHLSIFWKWMPLWILIGIIIGLASGWFLMREIQLSNYQSSLQSTSGWVDRQIRNQQQCFAQASSDLAKVACAHDAYIKVSEQQHKFNSIQVPSGMESKSAQLNNAFAALISASCYDVDTRRTDSVWN
jgi:uncharacterized membrane-anchored protein YhcB (DUF1043 family)